MKKLAFGFGLFVALIGAHAHADVPAGYMGKPHKGTPLTIPGRIEFEDFDDGGENVAWRVDDHTGNFGVGGCGANTYRTDMPHPQLCLTNDPGEVDTYSMGPLMGQLYPTTAMPQSIYIGYTHGADWVKLTVNVAKAGMYTLSSTWASDPAGPDQIKFQILFNDVLKADVKLPGTGGYHNWVAAPDFAMVSLDAGVQVLQFAPKSMHLNYDYLQLSLMLPGGGVDDGSMGAGGAGTGGGGGAAGNAGASGAAGSAGTGGTSGASGAGGAATSGAAGTLGTAGTSGTGTSGSAGTSGADNPIGVDPSPQGGFGTAGSSGLGSAGTPPSAGTGATGPLAPSGSSANQASGCNLAPERHSSTPVGLAFAAVGLLGGALRRRSRRFRARR